MSWVLVSIFVLLLQKSTCASSSKPLRSRSYSNPTTNRSLDAFFAIDASNKNLDATAFVQMKTAVSNIIENLRSGSVHIGILLYGSSQTVDILHTPAHGVESIARIKMRIEQKQFHQSTVDNPSTLQAALMEIERICNISCRDTSIPRLTLVLTSDKQPMVSNAQITRFSLYSRMTVIAVGIGTEVNIPALSLIASERRVYSISLASYPILIMSAQSIASVMSSVPPVLQYSDSTPTRYYDDDDLDLYNTIQYLVPDQKDHIAMIDFETSASGNINSPIKVYVSTLEPFPTSDSSDEAQFYASERCGKVLRLRYYLYMSEQVKRLYIGFVVTAQPQTIKYKVSSIDYFPIKSAGDILSPRHQAIITSFTGMANPKWKLLYKATQDGFRAIDFHRLCDNQTHTVTIIQSKTGYLFGGYAQIAWSSRNTYQTDLKAFIFTLTNPKSVLPTRFLIKGGFEQYSIHHGATYGPTFGGGHDIFVPDKSNENSGYTNFPHSYGDTTSYGNTMFTGNYNFMTSEIEVYKLI